MPVSSDTRDLCRSVFAPDVVELAVMALGTYAGPETWVHQAATRLSEGELHRLAHWLNEAERNPDTFRWYASEPTDVTRNTPVRGRVHQRADGQGCPQAARAAVSTVPDPCQIARGATRDSGHSPNTSTCQDAAAQQISAPIEHGGPKLPKLLSQAEASCPTRRPRRVLAI